MIQAHLDAAIKALRPKDKMYKVTDRDGVYVCVMPSGHISFRLDYRLNGRRETVYLGKYGRDGISLAGAGAVPGCEASDQRGTFTGN